MEQDQTRLEQLIRDSFVEIVAEGCWPGYDFKQPSHEWVPTLDENLIFEDGSAGEEWKGRELEQAFLKVWNEFKLAWPYGPGINPPSSVLQNDVLSITGSSPT